MRSIKSQKLDRRHSSGGRGGGMQIALAALRLLAAGLRRNAIQTDGQIRLLYHFRAGWQADYCARDLLARAPGARSVTRAQTPPPPPPVEDNFDCL